MVQDFYHQEYVGVGYLIGKELKHSSESELYVEPWENMLLLFWKDCPGSLITRHVSCIIMYVQYIYTIVFQYDIWLFISSVSLLRHVKTPAKSTCTWITPLWCSVTYFNVQAYLHAYIYSWTTSWPKVSSINSVAKWANSESNSILALGNTRMSMEVSN